MEDGMRILMVEPERRVVSEGWLRNWYADVKSEAYAEQKRLYAKREADAERIASFWARCHDDVTIELATSYLEEHGMARFLLEH